MTNCNKLNQEKKGGVCEFIHDEGTHLDTNRPPIKVKGDEKTQYKDLSVLYIQTHVHDI